MDKELEDLIAENSKLERRVEDLEGFRLDYPHDNYRIHCQRLHTNVLLYKGQTMVLEKEFENDRGIKQSLSIAYSKRDTSNKYQHEISCNTKSG